MAGLMPVVTMFPDYLRYGTTDSVARDLMTIGMRHRRSASLLGSAIPLGDDLDAFFLTLIERSAAIIDHWREALGPFVFDRTVRDVGAKLAS